MKQAGLLAGGTFVVWLLVVYPAWLVWGNAAVVFSAVAAGLCLVPAVATTLWSTCTFKGLPEQQLLAVMGGLTVRMLFVIGAGMALFFLHPDFHYQRFWIFVIGFYLVTLAIEVGILVRGMPGERNSHNPV